MMVGEEDYHDEASPASPEQVVRKLAEGEPILNGGGDLATVLRTLEISAATWNRWRAQYGEIRANEAKGRVDQFMGFRHLKKANPKKTSTADH